MFLQRPSAAAHMGHLNSLTVTDATDAVQRHGSTLMSRAISAVHDLLRQHLQRLCDILMQKEVEVVLQTAKAECQHRVVRATDQAVQQAQQAKHAQQPQHAQQQSTASSDFLRSLNSNELVQHAQAVKTGLQQLQLTHGSHDMLAEINTLATGTGIIAYDFRSSCLYFSQTCT